MTKPTSDQLRRTATHEASHGVVAAALRLPVKFLSVRPTQHYGGIMVPARRRRPMAPHNPDVVYLPLILWPARTRRWLEARAFVSLAGPVGSLYLGPRISGFVATTEDEALAEADARALARLHPATREAVLWQEAAAEPVPSDEDSSDGCSCAGRSGRSRSLAGLGSPGGGSSRPGTGRPDRGRCG